jgi:hypothetical protein
MYNLGRYSVPRIPTQISVRTRLELRLPYTTTTTTTTASASRTNRRFPTKRRKWLVGVSGILLLGGGAVWIAKPKERGNGSNQNQNQIDLTIFQPFELISKQNISSTCSLFTLASHRNNRYCNLYRDVWSKGKVWSVQIKQPQLQIARSYTPLPPPVGLSEGGSETETEMTELQFLIRREPQGEVSGYLHQLPVGAVVHVRGLNVEYEGLDDVDEVLFLAGGTGIAPAMQIAYWVLQRRRKSGECGPKMRILWANRRREDALGAGTRDSSLRRKRPWSIFSRSGPKGPPVQQDLPLPPSPSPDMQHASSSIVRGLEALKRNGQPGNPTIEYFIDEENSFITPDLLKNYLTTNCSKAANRNNNAAETPMRRKLILISGPDGFVTYYAGPKKWIGGRESQGPLGGILKGVDTANGWEIWKV